MLIVLVIVGIITAFAIPFVNNLARQKREADTRKHMGNIKQVILSYYVEHESLPSPAMTAGAPPGYQNYTMPIAALDLPPSAQIDKIYTTNYYGYVSTNEGAPFESLYVDGHSIGASGAVIVSRGRNLAFNAQNDNLGDGTFSEQGGDGFDDFLVLITEYELKEALDDQTYTGPDEMAELVTELPILTTLAETMAAYDDDVDGFVDEGGHGQDSDKPQDWDGITDWTIIDSLGLQALINAGLIYNPDLIIDPWGAFYIWDPSTHNFYSPGPDGIDDGGTGDDVVIGGGGG
jgi:type II secretory pathway pseudopilin PulG